MAYCLLPFFRLVFADLFHRHFYSWWNGQKNNYVAGIFMAVNNKKSALEMRKGRTG
jgi:hypothetical protein